MLLGTGEQIEMVISMKAICHIIAKHFGEVNQILKCDEELKELSVELLNHIDPSAISSQSKILDEIADVYIMLEQICYILNISDSEISHAISAKLKRTIDRITGGYYDEKTICD